MGGNASPSSRDTSTTTPFQRSPNAATVSSTPPGRRINVGHPFAVALVQHDAGPAGLFHEGQGRHGNQRQAFGRHAAGLGPYAPAAQQLGQVVEGQEGKVGVIVDGLRHRPRRYGHTQVMHQVPEHGHRVVSRPILLNYMIK
jgi:hypothetical protein